MGDTRDFRSGRTHPDLSALICSPHTSLSATGSALLTQLSLSLFTLDIGTIVLDWKRANLLHGGIN